MSRLYIDTAERAKLIRAALKAKGWNARKVSVRIDRYSMGSSIYLTIRSAEVNTGVAREIAKDLGETIHRDERGDILGGGNTYVHTSHSTEARADLVGRYLARMEDACKRTDQNKAEGHKSRLESVEEHPSACVGLAHSGWGYQLWIGSTMHREFDEPQTGAFELALHDADQVAS